MKDKEQERRTDSTGCNSEGISEQADARFDWSLKLRALEVDGEVD